MSHLNCPIPQHNSSPKLPQPGLRHAPSGSCNTPRDGFSSTWFLVGALASFHLLPALVRSAAAPGLHVLRPSGAAPRQTARLRVEAAVRLRRCGPHPAMFTQDMRRKFRSPVLIRACTWNSRSIAHLLASRDKALFGH